MNWLENINGQIFQETRVLWIKDLYEVIKKRVQVRRQINNFVQVQVLKVAAIVHSNISK